MRPTSRSTSSATRGLPSWCRCVLPSNFWAIRRLIPAQEGVGGDEGRHRFEALAPERVGQRSKAPALGIGEAQPATAEMRFEDTIFLEQDRRSPVAGAAAASRPPWR